MKDDRIHNEGLSTSDIAGERRGNEPEQYEQDMSAGPGGTARVKDEVTAPLFSEHEAQDLRSRWDSIQAGFVDEPRQSVEQADQLVASAMKRLAEIFSEERNRLERQWSAGDNVSTEDLRVALRRYRSFFARLLSV